LTIFIAVSLERMAGFGAAGYFSLVLAEAELDEAFVEAVLLADLELDTPVVDV
jgi:hypothetical protein